MEMKIKEVINDLFEKAPETQETKELKEEMISNAEEKYQDLIQRGFTEEQAYTMVMASIGDVQELLAELGAQAANDADAGDETLDEEKIQEEKDAGDEYWEKQSEYWKWQGEYLEKQAKNLGAQAKNALDSIIGSSIWENIANSVKQIINDVGSTFQDKGEYTDMTLYNERKFSEDGIKTLVTELQASPVDLDVQLTTESEILIQEYYNKEPQQGQTLEFTLNGSQLKLAYGPAVIGLSRRGTVKVFLPESLAGSLEEFQVTTTSGDITLGDIGAAKQCIKTVSGDINARAAIGEVTIATVSGDVDYDLVDGKLSVHTTSGDVSVQKVVGELCQSSVSGDVEIAELEGNAGVHTTSGDVSINVTKTGEKMEISTTSGDVEIDLPKVCSVQMTLSTASGDIDTFCDNIATSEKVDYVKTGKNAVGTVGEEPFLNLKVATVSGDIAVLR